MRSFYALPFLLIFLTTGFAQNPIVAKDTKDSSVLKNFKTNEPQAKVEAISGIELPADQTVPKDEGFITIPAKCDGEVKWLVLSTLKVKYFIIEKPNSIIISIPPVPGAVINVFAIGCISGKMTDHVQTVVTVEGKPDDVEPKPDPNPNPKPKPDPNPVPLPVGKLHYSIAFNPDAVTADIARVLNSENIRNAIVGKGDVLRVRELNSDIWAKTKLDKKISSVGGNFILIVQNANGNVLLAAQMPSNEKDFLDLIAKFKK
jgi:hypothetical protein